MLVDNSSYPPWPIDPVNIQQGRFSFHVRRQTGLGNPTTFVIMCCFTRAVNKTLDPWREFDKKLGKVAQSPEQVQLTIGFPSREDMLHFAEIILPAMPMMSKIAVHYMIGREDIRRYGKKWYQASLESEELTGTLLAFR